MNVLSQKYNTEAGLIFTYLAEYLVKKKYSSTQMVFKYLSIQVLHIFNTLSSDTKCSKIIKLCKLL